MENISQKNLYKTCVGQYTKSKKYKKYKENIKNNWKQKIKK